MDLSETDIAWLAGILEGEGCFSLANRGIGRKRSPRIFLKMTDKDVIERAALMMGVACRRVTTPNQMAREQAGTHKPVFLAQANGDRCRLVMRLVLKHMGERRTKRILESLEDWT